jgi:NAD(P)-dependent dehydrogenase (short-subunit alcohol dehydrogenase family)
MTGKLQGRVAVITGAANGCGRATARLFVQEGATVIGVDIDRDAGNALQAELAGERFLFLPADVSVASDVKSVVDRTVTEFGGVDILHNQAGTIVVKPLLELTEADFATIMSNNVLSVFLTTQAVLPSMLRKGRGTIINTSSVSSTTVTPMESLYCSSKAAVSQFTRAVAVEYRDRGIRANSICPGFVRTKHGDFEISQLRRLGIPASEEDIRSLQGRMCEPEEVAQVALFLASDDSGFINGADIVVDNTFTAI